MEVKNPLFNDDPTPKNPWRHPPGKKQTNKNPWTSFIGERDQKEKRPTRDLMANIDQSYCIHQARRHLPPIGQKAYFQQKSHINKEFIGCYQQCKKYIFIFFIKQTLIGVWNYDAIGVAWERKASKMLLGTYFTPKVLIIMLCGGSSCLQGGCKVVSGRVYKNARAGCEGWRRFVNLKTTFATIVSFSPYWILISKDGGP